MVRKTSNQAITVLEVALPLFHLHMTPVSSPHTHECKVDPRTGHEGPEGKQRHSSTLPLFSALDGVGGQCHGLSTLPPGKNRYSLYNPQWGTGAHIGEQELTVGNRSSQWGTATHNRKESLTIGDTHSREQTLTVGNRHSQ